jgi:heme A synthase
MATMGIPDNGSERFEFVEGRAQVGGSALAVGFATALVMWCIWFLTHLPGAGIPTTVSAPLLVAAWIAGAVAAGRAGGRRGGWKTGLLASIVTTLLNLLIFGSLFGRVAKDGTAGGAGLGTASAALLGAAVLVGLLGGFLGGLLRPNGASARVEWLGRFAAVTAATFVPLILLGGLVTSSKSGLAVPDWPRTYGSTMFLYPIDASTPPRVYLEHSHRLFGTLAGLTTLTLMVLTLLSRGLGRLKIVPVAVGLVLAGALAAFALTIGAQGAERAHVGLVTTLLIVPLVAFALITGPRLGPKNWAVALFLIVCAQGAVGGLRVTELEPRLGVLHGIVAQLVLAITVALAVFLSPEYRTAAPVWEPRDRKRRAFATGLVHSTVLQVILGATFRHLKTIKSPGAMHTMWGHVVFSVVVVAFAVTVGFLCLSRRRDADAVSPILRRLGQGLIVVVALQFLRGWVTLVTVLAGPGTRVPLAGEPGAAEPIPLVETLVATAHQANGALLLVLGTMTLVWTRRLPRPDREDDRTPA